MKKLTDEQIKKLEYIPVRLAEINFAMPEMPDDTDPEQPVTCKIDMLRTGKFVRESWYGSYLLNIDEMLIDRMIQNFDNKVIKRGVPLDIDHNKNAAYGWLVKLSKEYRDVNGVKQCYLVGEWELNKLGVEMVKNKIRNLFSLEFLFNYKDNEVPESYTGPAGEEVPIGALKMYGATITGGALTNRPFIPDLGTIKCSQEFNEISDLPKELKDSLKDNTFMFNAEMMTMLSNDPSGHPEKPVVNSIRIEYNNKVDPYIILFSDLSTNKKPEKRTQMDALKRLLSKLEQNLSKIDPKSEEYTNIKNEIAEVNSEIAQLSDSVKAKDEALKLSESKISELTTRVVKTENLAVKMGEQLAEQSERTRQSEITQFTSKLHTRGYTKPQIKRVEDILLANKNNDPILELSLEDGKKKSLNLRGVVEEILSMIPETAKVPMGDKFSYGTGNTSYDSDGEIELSASDDFEAKYQAAIERGTKKGIKSTIHQAKQ